MFHGRGGLGAEGTLGNGQCEAEDPTVLRILKSYHEELLSSFFARMRTPEPG